MFIAGNLIDQHRGKPKRDPSNYPRTSLRVVSELAPLCYARGVKVDPHFLANEPIIRDNRLSAYN